MLKHQLISAFRNLWKNRIFSAINVFGLSIGLSASMVIAMIIYSESTYDTFHKDLDKTYRISTTFSFNGEPFYTSGVPAPLKKETKEMDGVIASTGFFTMKIPKITTPEENSFKDIDRVILAQRDYFDFFQYNWLTSRSPSLFENPNEVVLTEKRANKYFPYTSIENVVGKTLTYNDSIPVTVVGVVADFKKRTDLVFEEFISAGTAKPLGRDKEVNGDDWGSVNSASQLFVRIDKNQYASLHRQLQNSIEKHNEKKPGETDYKRKYEVQPFKELHSEAKGGIFGDINSFNKTTLKGLAVVALFLLILGCINFINLSTAQATKRYKEVGVKKTLGSRKGHLIAQFILESFILTFSAGILSILISAFLINQFQDFLSESVSLSLLSEPSFVLIVLSLLVVVAVLSGIYPAFMLSKFKPVSILKNQLFSTKGNTSLRKSLTVFQFVVAQVFIIGTFLVGKQVHYMMNKDMGFKANARGYIETQSYLTKNLSKNETFRNEVTSIPEIENVSLASIPPANMGIYMRHMKYPKNTENPDHTINVLYGDMKYLDHYKISILAGRNITNDTIRECLVNEELIKTLGFSNPQEALGESLIDDKRNLEIVGVMKNFNQKSLKDPIKPLVFMGDLPRGKYTNFYNLHFSLGSLPSSQWKSAINKIEEKWASIYGEDEFKVKFVDDDIQKFYKQEQKTSKLLQWATGLAILISCLGLFGLVIYTTERRVKEIGIRKVLGASMVQLGLLLTKEFLILVGIAFVIAMPIAWYGIDYWLQSFTFKTNISWWIFASAGIIMIGTAFIVVFSRIWSATHKNPVESLRTE